MIARAAPSGSPPRRHGGCDSVSETPATTPALDQEKQRMSQRHKQTSAHRFDEHELDEAQLEAVTGGAGFLSGSLTTEQVATASIGGDGHAAGFIMKDSIIVRTSTR
jgi:hypothetical protein